MKKYHTIFSKLNVLFLYCPLICPMAGLYAQSTVDTVYQIPPIQIRVSQPGAGQWMEEKDMAGIVIGRELHDKLQVGLPYIIEKEVTADGDTLYQYRYMAFNFGEVYKGKPDTTVAIATSSMAATGALNRTYTYTAFGMPTGRTPESEPTLFLGRGYTGHEHLPWFGLVNMNARLYDPALGRFLSPDPYVQMPDFTQNFNRYSYCLNNPLSYVDLSGGKIEQDFITFITKQDPMFMHEYGHYLDSQIYGLSYLFVVGVPSLFSAQFSGNVDNTYNGKTYSQREHKFRWYERSANKRAVKYFEKYGVNWDTDVYENDPYEYWYPRKDRR